MPGTNTKDSADGPKQILDQNERTEAPAGAADDEGPKKSYVPKKSRKQQTPPQEHVEGDNAKLVDEDGHEQVLKVMDAKYEDGTWKYKLQKTDGTEELWLNGEYISESKLSPE